MPFLSDVHANAFLLSSRFTASARLSLSARLGELTNAARTMQTGTTMSASRAVIPRGAPEPRPGEDEHRCDGREGAEKRPFERVGAEDAARRFVRARAGTAERPEVDREPAGGGAEDVGAEADSHDAEDRPEREVRAAVHPRDLPIARDVAGVRADEAGEADREPLAVRGLERLHHLVEAGGFADEAERADEEDRPR